MQMTQENCPAPGHRAGSVLSRCSILSWLQVVEISSLTEHLLTECDKRDEFGKCHRCSEAVPMEELPRHIKARECNRECSVAMASPWCQAATEGWRHGFCVSSVSVRQAIRVSCLSPSLKFQTSN
jgi:hypothetical protein